MLCLVCAFQSSYNSNNNNSSSRRGQRPPKGLGTNNYYCKSNLAPKNARKHEAHPPRVKKKKEKKEFRLDSNDFGFIGVSNMVSYKNKNKSLI